MRYQKPLDLGSFSLGRVTSLLLCLFLTWQLATSFEGDAQDLPRTTADMLSFWLALLFAATLVVILARRNHLLPIPLGLILLLIVYLCAVVGLTKPEQDLIAFTLSRFGILAWFILGLGVAGMLEEMQKMRITRNAGLPRIFVALLCFSIASIVIPTAWDFITSPIITPNYQVIANNLTILLLILLLAVEAIWGAKKPTILVVGFVVAGSLSVAGALALQSTIIVPVWIGIVVIAFGGVMRQANLYIKFVSTLALAGGLTFIGTSDFVETLLLGTRFAELTNGSGGFTPLQNRIDLLSSFNSQFSIAPIFGNFNAENLTFSSKGNFIHSIPLSFLTHSGIVGFMLISTAVAMLLVSRIFCSSKSPLDLMCLRISLLVFLVGSIATFLTWQVFWFTLGLLCVRPFRNLESTVRLRVIPPESKGLH